MDNWEAKVFFTSIVRTLIQLTACSMHRLNLHYRYMSNSTYCKCPKSLHTKVSDNMAYANSVDPDQTPLSLHFCHSTKHFYIQLHEKQNYAKKVWKKVFKILGHLPYGKSNSSGPSCSKLKMSLVNDSLSDIRILYIESAKTVNEMTLNELVKLTTLWTTGPWIAHE